MKASELIQLLAKSITDSGEDIEVTFDTEGATFDIHCVPIVSGELYDPDFGLGDKVVLYTDKTLYIH